MNWVIRISNLLLKYLSDFQEGNFPEIYNISTERTWWWAWLCILEGQCIHFFIHPIFVECLPVPGSVPYALGYNHLKVHIQVNNTLAIRPADEVGHLVVGEERGEAEICLLWTGEVAPLSPCPLPHPQALSLSTASQPSPPIFIPQVGFEPGWLNPARSSTWWKIMLRGTTPCCKTTRVTWSTAWKVSARPCVTGPGAVGIAADPMALERAGRKSSHPEF